MSKLSTNALFILYFFISLGVGGCAAGDAADARAVRAYDIVDATLTAADDGAYRLAVKGHMRTGGHTNPRLRPVGAVRNRELVLELVAQAPPPGTLVPMVLQPVSAAFRIAAGDLKWVHVVAETNAVRQRLPRR